MPWCKATNLEDSLKDKLDTQIVTDSLVGDNGKPVTVRIGMKRSDEWTYPCITVYQESEDLTSRLYIGSNKRDEKDLIIIEIYATNDKERKFLAKWLTDTINNGWQFYTYAYNPSNPELPLKTIGDWVNVDFLTNIKVKLGQNISEIDQNRHRISINTWIS